jgi:inhibitor of cysteine peptidase
MNTKKINIFLFTAVLIISLSCSSTESEVNYTIGTIKYISLEGGFYGIIGDDAQHYDPINLAKEFQVDGKRIVFKYKVRTDLASFHMWGMIIEILDIQELK